MMGGEGGRTHAGVGAHGDGLGADAEGVLDVDVVELEVGRPDAQRGGEVVVGLRLLALGRDDGDCVGGVVLVVFRGAVDGQRAGELGDEDLLGVGARVNEDGLLGRGGVGQGGDGAGDGGELLAAADDEGAGGGFEATGGEG